MTQVNLGMPTVRHGVGNIFETEPFPQYAARELKNEQLRKNLGYATSVIRAKRARVAAELPDWQELRTAASMTKAHVMANLPEYLEQFEKNFVARGGHIYWARDAHEANEIALELIKAEGVDEIIKIKSMATAETGLNEYLEEHGISAVETDLAEEIVQLGDNDRPSHILVPAIHRNRTEIRDIFLRKIDGVDPNLTDEPARLAEASRIRLREKFLKTKVAVSGANFGIAETGTVTIVESEGNGRMCLTLPDTLITFMGIEKLLPTLQDYEVFLQLLPRSSTGERMNPYTSMWTGVTPGDGPQKLHLILIDNGRTAVLSDPVGRQALHCIRCSACMNVCPVYERAGGHAYGSTYPGPIGAILSPQLGGIEAAHNNTLPYASSLCGACYEVCPVKINIPDVLVHLRNKDVEAKKAKAKAAGTSLSAKIPSQTDLMMLGANIAFRSGKIWGAIERLAGITKPLFLKQTRIKRLPGMLKGWTNYRDFPLPTALPFREWYRKERGADAPSGNREPIDLAAILEANKGRAAEAHAQALAAEVRAAKADEVKGRSAEADSDSKEA